MDKLGEVDVITDNLLPECGRAGAVGCAGGNAVARVELVGGGKYAVNDCRLTCGRKDCMQVRMVLVSYICVIGKGRALRVHQKFVESGFPVRWIERDVALDECVLSWYTVHPGIWEVWRSSEWRRRIKISVRFR